MLDVAEDEGVGRVSQPEPHLCSWSSNLAVGLVLCPLSGKEVLAHGTGLVLLISHGHRPCWDPYSHFIHRETEA